MLGYNTFNFTVSDSRLSPYTRLITHDFNSELVTYSLFSLRQKPSTYSALYIVKSENLVLFTDPGALQ